MQRGGCTGSPCPVDLGPIAKRGSRPDPDRRAGRGTHRPGGPHEAGRSPGGRRGCGPGRPGPRAGDGVLRQAQIPRVVRTYEELVADPEIDAVYIPLPNGLHGHWTLAAMAAGKHVLCEKPFTADAAEARTVAGAATTSGLVVAEAFHYRYHPLAARLEEIVRSGELGPLRHIEVAFSAPIPMRGDIRYRLDLAGGALMDMGCYTVSLLRLLAGAADGGVGPGQALLARGRPGHAGPFHPARGGTASPLLDVLVVGAGDPRQGGR